MALHVRMPENVERPGAYANAVEARILANTRKGWLERIARAREAADFLDAGDYRSPFLCEMKDALDKFGKLSFGQLAAVLRIMDAPKQAREQSVTPVPGGLYVGTVGERADMVLTVKKMRRKEHAFGMGYWFLCEAENGAVVVYAGSCAIVANEGDTAKLRATIEAHGQYRGAAQTSIKRPAVVKK